nr:unnamed protein product [Callosobruchus analis]
MEWCNQKYLDFIEDYRKCEVLWDVRNSKYKNNRIKRDYLLGLARKYDLVEDDIKKKIKNLRSAFHREHNRIVNKKSGSGFTNDNKKWFAYDSLKFILDVTEPRAGTSSTINEDVTSSPKHTDSDTCPEENMDANISAPAGPPRPTSQNDATVDQLRKKRKRSLKLVSQTENEKRAEEAYHILKKSASNDDHSVYGQHVANESRKLSPISTTINRLL